ncbi:SIMPL domain-containing protein [Fibrella sp. HMF5335]|uniref:SIMPL domain-containing protein n=1 Tax=Fibrella rubiginis TaxID=2817060 RepID=A0A939GDQ4_9BACT|nr:SIMPL domain-containing protein [Fibrella rubiginis]MBO0936466.1 SIMPL domain-containing protein [Fibrella rubiginis]
MLNNQPNKFSNALRSAIFIGSLLTLSPLAAQPTDQRIFVLGDATEEVLADQATLNLNLSFSDERDVNVAFEEHQQARQQLTTLLTQQRVANQDIQFLQLLSRKGRDYQRGQQGERFTTYQRVLIKFADLTRFNQVQQALASNGYTDMTASFSVSDQRAIELRLLDKALARAQEKATQLAKATSRTIKRVVRVSDVGENEGFYAYRDLNRATQSQTVVNYDDNGIRQMAITPQLFRYGAAVKVEFELTN